MLYTVFDTETSGLEAGCDILSFAYALCNENLRVMRAEVLYFWKEGVTQWTEEAYAINKLSKEFLRSHADEYETNLKKMYIVLSMADLVGYNSGYISKEGVIKGFDFARCKSFLMRNGYPMPTPRTLTDIMRVYQSHHAGFRAKLTKAFAEYKQSPELAAAICEGYFHDPSSNPHCASYDTAMTMMLLSEFSNRGWIGETTSKVDLSSDAPEIEENKDEYSIVIIDGVLTVRLGESSMPMEEFMKVNPQTADMLLTNIDKYYVQEV